MINHGNGNSQMSVLEGTLENGNAVIDATLTIEAGTQVKAAKGTFANLLITRGSKIEATGTATDPIVFSSDEGRLEFANLFIIPVSGGNSTRITFYNGYDGAPSWSPDGTKVAFESYQGDPDDSAGTTLWIIEISVL